MRKEVEEIVAAKLKERENDRSNQSTDSLNVLADKTKEQKIEGNDSSITELLQEILNETKKQTKLLSENKYSSNILEKIIFVFAGLSLISALASINIASLELNDSGNPTGLGIFYLTLIFIFIGIIIIWAEMIKTCLKKIGDKHQTLRKIFEAVLMIGISLISVIITINVLIILPLLGIFMLIITIIMIGITICHIIRDNFTTIK
ncbi:MAG: hypothetical protein Q7J08_03415 [Methanocorpusculum sp.]|uniref:hypothetical protein n=1 Tax=Methanocorpusculum sp. TaxID=2058474 RepID=UPI0027272F06|nr:hypothetical protein [Methanocorpusculum sp.]MDO9522743.1 hypothetical protein [Methanocorpusculum sp.]